MISSVVGRVMELWRYPVKSMGGEPLARADVGSGGITGDRAFGLIDDTTGLLLSAKRVPQLLNASASYRSDGEVTVLLPGGPTAAAESAGTSTAVSSDDPNVHEVLSNWLGRPVRLERPRAGERAVIEIETDLDDPSVVHQFSTRPGWFFDSGAVLHLLTPASLRSAAALHPLGQWSISRFRPNLVVETPEGAQGWVEDAWTTATLQLGGVEAAGRKSCERCIVTTRAQPGLQRDVEVLQTLASFHDSCLGIYLDVTGVGSVLVGDDVVRVEPDPSV